MKTIIILISLSFPFSYAWAGMEPLVGNYELNSGGNFEPDPNKSKKSHLSLLLKGSVAKELYNSFNRKEKLDECSGLKRKQIGNVLCLFNEKDTSDSKYTCQFYINLESQKIEYNGEC